MGAAFYYPSLGTIFLLLSFLWLIYYYCCFKLNYWRRRGVPQLKTTHLIFGDFKNGFLFRSPPGYHFGDLYRQSPKNAPYVGIYLSHKPCLLLKDPEMIKQIFIRDFEKFSDRYFAGTPQMDSTGMINLFGLKNPAWRYLRKKITPLFTRSKLKQMLPFMMDASNPMMEFLKKKVESNENKVEVIDAQDVNYRFTADVIANVALGFKSDSFNGPESDYTKNFLNYFHSFKRMFAIFTVFFIPEMIRILGFLILYDSSYMRKVFWNIINAREKSGVKRGDFIDTLIQLKNGEQDPIYKFEGQHLFSQTGTFFSGLETSSNVSAFTLMELAKNPQYQERARECIDEAVAKHGWTIEGLNAMKFLEQCVSEGLRMHPSVSTLDRYALEDYKFPDTDLVIEKGTPVYISLYGVHRDPQFFENPDVFDPDRFGEGRAVSDNYLPFGVGPRACIGSKAGLLFVKVVLAKILSEYRLVYKYPVAGLKLDRRATFTTAANGINVEFTKLTK
ncbi:unnamed protein product [Pieris macdunnoughi]|uniref:unspecific monooxygenase n=1 Tax=Pieris macdunnoughi TaxID=345717 RepID=A0A821VBN3_9NEOP|nr:unnamed protein product [Pieris macdunnoughi]